jgi:hypothetical protein
MVPLFSPQFYEQGQVPHSTQQVFDHWSQHHVILPPQSGHQLSEVLPYLRSFSALRTFLFSQRRFFRSCLSFTVIFSEFIPITIAWF